MRSFVTLVLLVASASAASYGSYDATLIREAPYSSQLVKQIPITSFSQDIRGSLENDVTFTSGNGIAITDNTKSLAKPSSYEDEAGRMVQSDSTLLKTGSFSYTSPEGLPISLNYVADEGGFHATGAHLPVAPLPVEKTPEVLQAEAEHFALVREAIAKAPAGSYDNSYAAPAFVRTSSYEAPAMIRTSSYEAPAIRTSSYEAPAIRTSSYEAPVIRSSYAAPAVVRVEPVAVRISGY